MGTEKKFWCDLCSTVMEAIPGELFGLRFTDMRVFKVGNPRLTDGKHVCYRCLKQLIEQGPTYDSGDTRSV